MVGTLKVKIFDSKGTRVLQVAKSTLTIGSASHCDVVLSDTSIASEHTRAWIDGGRIWIQDLGGENGTSLNEIRLPALKPMLVRDLDVLRLGTSQSTLGLEAILVRAPAVVAPAPSPSPSASPAVKANEAFPQKDLAKRKEEAEHVSRELADLRLQLQMAKMEKTSNAELAGQLRDLQGELQKVHAQKGEWTDRLRKMENEKQVMRKNVETELEAKAKALKEIKKEFDIDREKFEIWKKERLSELARQNHALSVQKVKAWGARSLSKEMINEWEADILHMLRKVLLGVNEPAPPRAPMPDLEKTVVAPLPTFAVTVPQPAVEAAKAETVAEDTERRRKRKSRERRAARRRWRMITVSSVVVLILLAGLWIFYGRPHGQRSLSSQSVEPTAPVEAVSKRRYEPKQGKRYRNSYTENVLFLENYVVSEENEEYRKHWTTELTKVASTDWKMDLRSIGPLVNEERALISDLSRMKAAINPDREQEGVERMRARETRFLQNLDAIFKNRANVERFLRFKRTFYVRNQGGRVG